MAEVFEQMMMMSLQACIAVAVVMGVRWVFNRLELPKKFCYILWFIPVLRMVLPVFLESPFGLMPGRGLALRLFPAPEDAGVFRQTGAGHLVKSQNAANILDSAGSGAVNSVNPAGVAEVTRVQVILEVCAWVWLAGIMVLLVFSLVSVIRLKKKLACSAELDGEALAGRLKAQNGTYAEMMEKDVLVKAFKTKIFLADDAETPFVYGLLHPRIYLPSSMDDKGILYVLAHEQVHLLRNDHIVKGLVWLVAAVHWFNPLAWMMFAFMTRDMEMSCDEKVLEIIGNGHKKDYARTLLALTVGKRPLMGMPAAFGETDTKGRVKNVMGRKKKVFAATVLAAVAICILAAGLLTNRQVHHDADIEALHEMRMEVIRSFFAANYRISDEEYETFSRLLEESDCAEAYENAEYIRDKMVIAAELKDETVIDWVGGRYADYVTEDCIKSVYHDHWNAPRLAEGLMCRYEYASVNLSFVDVVTRKYLGQEWYQYQVTSQYVSEDGTGGTIVYGGNIYFSDEEPVKIDRITTEMPRWDADTEKERVYDPGMKWDYGLEGL